MKVGVIGGWAVPRCQLEFWVRAAVPTGWELSFWPLDGSEPGFWPTPDAVSKLDLLLGWSLGGQYAVRLAQDAGLPVITVASGPRFAPDAERQAWLDAFTQDFEQDAARALKRFAMMMAHGSGHDRHALRQMQQVMTDHLDERTSFLIRGLQALRHQDVTPGWRGTAARRLSLAFRQDAVFPLLTSDPATELLPGGHWPDARQCADIRERLEAWEHG